MELRAFLVEDSATGRALLEELFASVGRIRVVASAVSEAQAREWLQAHPGEWDLVVVDLVLEQGSGLGVIRTARESPPRRPVVVFSAYGTPGMREHCLKLGADAAFDKTELPALRNWLLSVRARSGD